MLDPQLQNHTFFRTLDWDKLEARRLVPPKIPEKSEAMKSIQKKRMTELEKELATIVSPSVHELVQATHIFAAF